VHVKFDLLAWLPQLQTREGFSQAGHDLGLNLPLQFLARRRLQRRHGRIGGARNEPAFRLGLDPVNELLHQACELHGKGL
jgi:hypothetical protein